MVIHVNPADPRPLYLQIIDEVRRALVVGTLRPDDPLPSVRQLAAELRVNPNTVQQAYRELERDGVAYVRRGLGTFAARPAAAAGERRKLVRRLAAETLREAYRQGLEPAEVIAALDELARADGGSGETGHEEER